MQLSYPKKIFQWLNIATRLNLKEDWIFKYKDYTNQSVENYIIKDGFKRRLTSSLSATFNTKIYGVFPVNIGSFEAVRHTITPSLSISYSPDITKNRGSFNKIFSNIDKFQFSPETDLNESILLDPFYGSVVPPTSNKENLIYTFKLQNLFQTKYNNGTDVYKNDLINITSRATYNASAEDLQWSPIQSNLRSKIPGISNIDISFTHDIYKLNKGRRIDEYQYLLYGIPIPSMTKLSCRTTISLLGKRLIGFETDSTHSIIPITSNSNLWAINLGLTYNKQKKYNYTDESMIWDETFQLNTNTILNFSEEWKLSYQVGFDLIEQTMGWQSFTFGRNLHCWKFDFKWIPNRSYFLHIYVSKPELRDIKLESRSKNNKNDFF